jgi:hypothetical protein
MMLAIIITDTVMVNFIIHCYISICTCFLPVILNPRFRNWPFLFSYLVSYATTIAIQNYFRGNQCSVDRMPTSVVQLPTSVARIPILVDPTLISPQEQHYF